MTIKLRCPSCLGDDLKQATQEQATQEQANQLFVCNNHAAPIRFRVNYEYDQQATQDNEIHCPSCDGGQVRKFGKRQGKQIYRCNNNNCDRTTFRREYAYKACDPRVKSLVQDLRADGIGARAIGRMLSISKDTAANTLKKLEEETADDHE